LAASSNVTCRSGYRGGKIEQDNIIDVIYSFHSLSQHNQEAGKLFHQHIDSVKLGDDLSLLQLLI
jgi:lysine-N-methylase